MKKILCAGLAVVFAASLAIAADRPSWAKPVDAVTGKLIVYTTMEETQQAVMRKVWEMLYPKCSIEFQNDSVGTLITRLKAEASAPVADVLMGGLFAADGSRYHDVLQKYISVNDPLQNYHDPAGYYNFFDVQIMCLVVNKTLRDELGVEIKGYGDLLNPKLKGKIILAQPSATSSAYRQLQTILATMGDKFDDEKAWAYIEKLIAQCNGVITNSSSQVYNDVINGEYVVGLSYESTVLAMIDQGADHIECVYMKEGNTAMASGGAIVKGAKNIVAAEAMMDIATSNLFQDMRVRESGGRGTNSLCEGSGVPSEKELNVKPLDYDYLRAHQAELFAHFSSLWEKVNAKR